MIFLFKAKNGTWDFGSEYNFRRFLQNLKENEGKVYRIEPEINTRTLSQNNLYWKYLGIIEMETGQESQSMHEYFRRTFLPPKFIKYKDKEIKIPTSTTELNKVEFADYLDKISSEVGVPIPDTDSYLREIDLAPTK